MLTAARLLNPEDRHLDLLCVMPKWNRKDETLRRTRYEERILRETTRILERAKAMMCADAVDIRRITDAGSPAAIIAVTTGDYDLTVIVVAHALGPVLIS